MSLFITMTNALLLKLDCKVGFHKNNYITLVCILLIHRDCVNASLQIKLVGLLALLDVPNG